MEYLLLSKIWKLVLCIFIYLILRDISYNKFFNKKGRGE